MVPRMTTILQRFTTEWAARLQPEAFLTVWSEVGSTGWRNRVLTPVTTVPLCLWQMLHGHTACRHLPHRSGVRFTAAAYGQARATLPLHVFALLLERFSRAAQRSTSDDGRWHEHRTCLVGGSGGSMPDTPALQETFGQPSGQRPGGGFPMARRLGRFHASSGVRLNLVIAPLLTHALAQVPKVHPLVAPGDGLVADRGLCASCASRPPHAIWRARRAARQCTPDGGLHARSALGPAEYAADAGGHRHPTLPMAHSARLP
jgi:hypothetical protein